MVGSRSRHAQPSLLQRLRKQSDELRAQDTAARQPFEAAVKAIDTGLWGAFRWLDEALGHLEVIHPKVAHRFQLGNILTVTRPRFERGFVAFRRGTYAGFDVLSYIEMFYRLSGPEPFILRVNPAAANGIEERLRAAPMQFQYQTEQDAGRIVRYGLFRAGRGAARSAAPHQQNDHDDQQHRDGSEPAVARLLGGR